MRRLLCWIGVLGCLSLNGWCAEAADVQKLSDTDRKQVNEWMAQRAKAMIDAHKLEREIKATWSDPNYATPEVETLRKHYRELQEELVRTQREIQEKMRTVPELQPKVRLLDEMKQKELDLTKKLEDKAGE